MKVLIDNVKISTKTVNTKGDGHLEYFFGKYSGNTVTTLQDNTWQEIYFDQEIPEQATIGIDPSFPVVSRLLINKTGLYRITASVLLNSVTYTRAQVLLTAIAINAVKDSYGSRVNTYDAISENKHSIVSNTFYLQKGDTVSIEAIQSSGGPVAVSTNSRYTYLSICELKGES